MENTGHFDSASKLTTAFSENLNLTIFIEQHFQEF